MSDYGIGHSSLSSTFSAVAAIAASTASPSAVASSWSTATATSATAAASAASSAAPQRINFANFKTPDAQNIRLYRLYIRKRFGECRRIVEEILTRYNSEALCESQLLLMAKIAREEANLRESLAWLERARVHNPRSTKILYEIGKSHYLLAEHEKAIEMFSEALKRNPDDWKIYYWQSLAYYHVYRPPLCIQKAQEVLISCPYINKSTDILMFLARLLGEQNDIGPAIEAYKHSIQLEPENVDLIHSLGMLYLKTQNEENAFATLGKALTYDANYVPSVLAISSVLQSRGDFDVALSKYRVAATDFDHSCALWNNIGMCYYGRGKLITAISCLSKANYLCPLDWKVLYNLSLCYFSMRQFASTYHFIAAAFALCPQHPLILMMIAMTLTELGDFRNARAAYKRALKLSPELFVVRLNFAIFEYRRGNVVAALRRVGASLREHSDGYEELNILANRLRSCLEKVAEENADVNALLRRVYANQISAAALDDAASDEER